MLFYQKKIFKIINNYLFYEIDSFIDKNSDIIYTTSQL